MATGARAGVSVMDALIILGAVLFAIGLAYTLDRIGGRGS